MDLYTTKEEKLLLEMCRRERALTVPIVDKGKINNNSKMCTEKCKRERPKSVQQFLGGNNKYNQEEIFLLYYNERVYLVHLFFTVPYSTC